MGGESGEVSQTFAALIDAAAARAIWERGVARAEWFAGVERAAEEARWARIESRWNAVNACEQGGDWHAYGRFGNGLMGGGGLGISDGAWQSWGGGEFASTAAGATPRQQMIVAERIYADVGGSAWGCPVP